MSIMFGLNLTGKRVLFVGGGSVAARRIPRYLEEGGDVVVVAPELDAAVAGMVEDHAVAWIPRAVVREDLEQAWLVHTASGSSDVDARVSAWCDEQRTFCIRASDGTRGSARSAAQSRVGDVVVGVVSDVGVDPRRTARVSAAVRHLMENGDVDLRRARSTATGSVALVGGGPGPTDLMTLRGRRMLAEADVVVADRLGPTSVLDDLDPDVEVVHVGKWPGHHPVPQEEINAILVRNALAGKRVVRLKGGDPFVYGRGGEEVTACLRAGVAVEVVPGPSSIVSVPLAAGIPVTHRGTASGMLVINGQREVSDSTLAALKDPEITTVLLMGVSAFADIADQALARGVPCDTPVAFVEQGYTARQRTTRARLEDAAARAESVGVSNPAVIVIGDVAREGLLLPEMTTMTDVAEMTGPTGSRQQGAPA